MSEPKTTIGTGGSESPGNGRVHYSPAQTIFTTGQVAKICQVAPRTVSKWFDSGKLGGYRIPGSTDRRVPRKDLIEFLRKFGLPLGDLEDVLFKHVLLIGVAPLLVARLHEYLREGDGYQMRVAVDGFDAGVRARDRLPCPVVVIDLSMGRQEALQIAARLRRDENYATAVLVALAGEDETPEAMNQLTTLEGCFCNVLKRPFDPALLTAVVTEAFDGK